MNTTLLFTGGMFELVLDDEQMRRASELLEAHSRKCPAIPLHFGGQLGSPLAYVFRFRPYGCSEVVEVVCNCGERLDISTID